MEPGPQEPEIRHALVPWVDEPFDIYFKDVSEEERRSSEVRVAQFLEIYEELEVKDHSQRRLQDARQIEGEHKAALRRYQKAHRSRESGFDEMLVDCFWGSAIRDLLEICLLHRINPTDGVLSAFADRVHEDLFDYKFYGEPAIQEDEMVARTIAALSDVYERVLGRSDADKGRRGMYEAAKLTPAETSIQAHEIASSLEELGIDLTDRARRSCLVDELITSADEIRFYPAPEEEDDDDLGPKRMYRGPAQAASQNVGKILRDLLGALGLYVEGVRLRPTAPLGERSMMGRMAAAKRRNLRSFDPTSRVMYAADAVLRDELEGELFEETMTELSELISRKLEVQRRISEERDS